MMVGKQKRGNTYEYKVIRCEKCLNHGRISEEFIQQDDKIICKVCAEEYKGEIEWK